MSEGAYAMNLDHKHSTADGIEPFSRRPSSRTRGRHQEFLKQYDRQNLDQARV